MLHIPCPYCGVRDETEFTYGGPSHVSRPMLACSDGEWTRYLFNRKNTMGPYRERWVHSFGCGSWFNMQRDTVTHEILKAYPMGDSVESDESEQPVL